MGRMMVKSALFEQSDLEIKRYWLFLELGCATYADHIRATQTTKVSIASGVNIVDNTEAKYGRGNPQ